MLDYLLSLHVLIIDEVSMLSAMLFDKIAELFKIIHKTDRPFGKLQLILVGDMSQLKPVEGEYCFCASNWEKSNINISILTENMRVHTDTRFDALLQKLRWGILTDLELIEKMKHTDFSDTIRPTKLFSKNKDVDTINQHELGLLLKENESVTYKVLYSTNPLKLSYSTKYATDAKIPEFLTLCVGAQVMVNRNICFDEGIVNGTRGIIVSLTATSVTLRLVSGSLCAISYFHVKSEDVDERYLDFKYLPLQLSWAMSIHKSQGATIDCLEIDLGESIFTSGQAYVAISRARNSESVKITHFNKKSIKVDPLVLSFYERYT